MISVSEIGTLVIRDTKYANNSKVYPIRPFRKRNQPKKNDKATIQSSFSNLPWLQTQIIIK